MYEIGTTDKDDPIRSVAGTANDVATAEQLVRARIGTRSNSLDRQEVVLPLADALLKAIAQEPRDAVSEAARAFESFLAALAGRMGVVLTGANGINQKLDKFRSNNELPKKVVETAKFLGHIRNAADHGVDVDPDVGAVWGIRAETGTLYVLVACAVISSCLEREANSGFSL